MKNRVIKPLLMISLAGCMVLSMTGCSQKKDNASQKDTATATGDAWEDEEEKQYEYHESGMENDKEESVYVLAKTDGTPRKITVTEALKNPGKDKKIEDYTLLTHIKNKEGDEAYKDLGDGNLQWENHGDDVHYEGTADPEKQLPLTVKVTYYLNGKKVKGSDLAGKSGKVKIRFDYTNNTKKGNSITPFMAVTGMTFDGEKVSHIKVKNGKATYMDGDYVVYGCALPGVKDIMKFDSMDITKDKDIDIPEYLEVSMDAKEFALDFSATMFSNGFLDDEDNDLADQLSDMADEIMDSTSTTSSMKSSLNKLKKAGKDLYSGAKDLNEGLKQLNDTVAEMAEVNPQMEELSKSVAALAKGSESLATGVKEYTGGVNKAMDKIQSSASGKSSEYQDKAKELRSIAKKIKKMQKNDKDYENFAGIKKGQTGSVSFIIETDEITK
ncbi:MAG: methyl-accepting chemotaxis protein [Lachnospiraceae bacterium]|nr:methyl-accepting chemotaxis protein [Lachnospiraceae bacterium]